MFDFNKVFQGKPKTPEITPEELKTITVMTGPETSEKEVLDLLREGEAIDFVLTRHNVYLTRYSPEKLFDKLYVKEKDCLIPNGVVQFEEFSGTIKFDYRLEDGPMTEAKRMSQKKIIEFLSRRGFTIEKIG